MSLPTISVYIAASLDGFIARPNGDIDWLTRPDSEILGEDFGYQQFMDSVDVLVMGRHTYEKVLSFGGDWPFADKQVVVLSSGQPAVPTQWVGQIEVMALPPADMIGQLGQRGFQHIYLDGGQTIQQFLREGLVHELTITRIPVLLGQGLPLFGEISHDIQLEHVRTTAFSNGFVQSVYRPVVPAVG